MTSNEKHLRTLKRFRYAESYTVAIAGPLAAWSLLAEHAGFRAHILILAAIYLPPFVVTYPLAVRALSRIPATIIDKAALRKDYLYRCMWFGVVGTLIGVSDFVSGRVGQHPEQHWLVLGLAFVTGLLGVLRFVCESEFASKPWDDDEVRWRVHLAKFD